MHETNYTVDGTGSECLSTYGGDQL